MQLHLMRHALAVPPEAWDGDEIERPLTPEGQRLLRQATHGLTALGVTYDLIATSPYRRAVETAEIVAQVVPNQGGVEECPALSPGVRPDILMRFLELFDRPERVLLVGHAPDMGRLALSLIGCPQPQGLPMETGAMCRVDVKSMPPEERGRLVWALSPEVLRAIAAASSPSA